MNDKAIALLNKLKKVGKISLPKSKASFLRAFYRKNRAHLSFSHYPIALFAFSFFMLTLFAYFTDTAFFSAAKYSAICASVMLIPAVISGVLTYRTNFKTAPVGNFNIKMKKILVVPVVTFAVALICLFLYQHEQDVALKMTTAICIWVMLLIMESNGKQLVFKEN